MIEVPDVVGQTESDARQQLNQAGFNDVDTQDVDALSTGSNERADGIVLAQEPTAGSTTDPDKKVTLRVQKTGNDDSPTRIGPRALTATTEIAPNRFDGLEGPTDLAKNRSD